MTLPAFKFHSDPTATGSIKRSEAKCECCGQRRGFIYTGPVYCVQQLSESVCPWCIADGSAAGKFEAVFSDDHPLIQAGVPDAVVEEVTRRTPGFSSWQQEVWLSCCGDACEFHGDAPHAELQALRGDDLARTLADFAWREEHWPQFIQTYHPGGNPAVYKLDRKSVV